MFPKEIQFRLDEDRIVKNGYVYKVRLDQGDWWSVYWWKRKPTDVEIGDIKWLILRGMEVYYRALRKPAFNMIGI